MLRLLRRARVTGFEANARTHGYEVDFLWREQRLVLEVDGYAFHSSRRSFELDRRRDQVMAAAGFRVTRATWRQTEDEAIGVAARLGAALSPRS